MFVFILFLVQKDEVYLNLVLEYIPETVYKVARHYSKSKQTIPISFIKIYRFFEKKERSRRSALLARRIVLE
ncbi:hypothetical protein NQ318_002747 [Aromia moschata]|uniref:Uncharacterized protein n=1 Tax=Aromia moschata TaxID=1265417 RepID=A0AAV8Y259_9CUCU|nr:hypothetical protein NQ318_002747 [Aromia moschata]